MSSTPENDLETRVANIEQALVTISEQVWHLTQQRAENPSSGMSRPQPVAQTPRIVRESLPPRQHAPREQAPPAAPEFPSVEWIASRSAEWWVGSLGVLFLVIASFLLYQYAVDHRWITPLVRVIGGFVIGAGMFVAAQRFAARSEARDADAIGLREILLGGGIAVWYLTSYAAGVLYNLVSMQTARWMFLVLSMIAGWVALKERRVLFAVIALGVGFAAPLMLLSSPWQPQLELSRVVYLVPLGALGLTLYLMRGWDLVLWITFVGYWINYPSVVAGRVGSLIASTLTSLVAIIFAAAFVRAPILRRRLVALDPERYGTSGRAADVLLWIVTIATPMIALAILFAVWPRVGNEVWGAFEVALAVGAYWFARRVTESDQTLSHVGLTAAAIWSLAGLEWITIGLTARAHVDFGSYGLAVAAIHAGFVIYAVRERFFNAPRRFAKLIAAVALFTVIGFELSPRAESFQYAWTFAETVVLALSAWLWLKLREDESEEMQATGFAVLGYGTLLLVLARVLGAVWVPFVTASYAAAGVTLLVMSRRGSDRRLLLRLGALTMIVVVGRLIIVDMSSVETIWRVLLFLACGVAFVGVSYRLQSAPAIPRAKSTSG